MASSLPSSWASIWMLHAYYIIFQSVLQTVRGNLFYFSPHASSKIEWEKREEKKQWKHLEMLWLWWYHFDLCHSHLCNNPRCWFIMCYFCFYFLRGEYQNLTFLVNSTQRSNAVKPKKKCTTTQIYINCLASIKRIMAHKPPFFLLYSTWSWVRADALIVVWAYLVGGVYLHLRLYLSQEI